jgi:FKBP12-rapamycin complex-associated protein
VGGIEGSYRAICESVMRVLRRNHLSLMAVLEAFVHDPLLSWRVLSQEKPRAEASSISSGDGGGGDSIVDADDDDDDDGTAAAAGLQIPRQDELEGRSAGSAGPSGTPPRRTRADVNKKAVAVIKRVQDKQLAGRDFGARKERLGVTQQVDKLIKAATSVDNLCQSFIGWCPYW